MPSSSPARPVGETPLDRLNRVHEGAFVHDFAPLGGPFVMTERHAAVMNEAINAGLEVPEIIRRMARDRLSELADPAAREALARVWEASGVNAVTLTLGGLELAPSNWDAVLREAAYWREFTRVFDRFVICTTAAELEAAHRAGRVAIILGMQDASPIGTDIDRLTMLHHLGVRVIQLTFNRRNLIGDGCTERDASGLSLYGLEVVEAMNEQGILIDLSHCGRRTTIDAIEASSRPVAMTHASCAAITPHPRAKTDDELEKLARKDGYIGILALPFYLSTTGQATIDLLVRHVMHAAAIVGWERVGIGTDWGPWCLDFPDALKQQARAKLAGHGFSRNELPDFGAVIPELPDWQSWRAITQALLAAGLSEDTVRGVIGGNWLRFMARAGL